jgi:hypothetical protein
MVGPEQDGLINRRHDRELIETDMIGLRRSPCRAGATHDVVTCAVRSTATPASSRSRALLRLPGYRRHEKCPLETPRKLTPWKPGSAAAG